MTKEELKKESIQYAVDYPTSYGKGYKHKDLRVAYLAGAEPREKRISELEAYNAKLLNGDIEKHNKIVELEAELAKRAEQIEALNKDKDYFSDALDKQIEATEKLLNEYHNLEKENAELKAEIEDWKDSCGMFPKKEE